MQPEKRKLLVQWLWIHLALGLGALLLLWLIDRGLFFCPTARFLRLYCPGCGGTRALLALLHGRVRQALLLHPGGCFLVGAALWYEVRALCFLLARRPSPLRLRPVIPLTVFLVLALGYAVFRNIALVYFAWDPIGDLLPLWHPGA